MPVNSLRHFKRHEFRGYDNLMDPALLVVIDEFREQWGAPVRISNSAHAIGRTYGNGFHNYVKHGSVKAIDLIPEGMETKEDFERAVKIAQRIGAKGIGLYPKWHQGPGIHLDVGIKDGVDRIRTWSALPTGPDGKQEYYGINEAYNHV